MFLRLACIRLAAAILPALAAASAAHAQAPAGPGPGAVNTFSVTAGASTGYDSDLVASGVPDVESGAAHAGTGLTLNFIRQSEGFSAYTAASSEFRYYGAQVPIKAPMFSAASGIATALGRRAVFDAAIQGNYFPRFQLAVMPIATAAPLDQLPSPDFGVLADNILSYQGTIGLGYKLSPRTTISGGYGRGHFRSLDDDYELRSHAIRGSISRTLTRNAGLRLGYIDQQATYGSNAGLGRTQRSRVIDAGINYSRPLSLSRRTELSFSTGSTAVDNGSTTRYSVTGSARLNHHLARYWGLAAIYVRGLGYIGGFDEPLFSDAVSLVLSGRFGRTASVSVSGGYANGVVGFITENNDYESYQATSRVDIPFGRRLSLYGSYFYYQYRIDDSIVLRNRMPSALARHGVRTGLIWAIFGGR